MVLIYSVQKYRLTYNTENLYIELFCKEIGFDTLILATVGIKILKMLIYLSGVYVLCNATEIATVSEVKHP